MSQTERMKCIAFACPIELHDYAMKIAAKKEMTLSAVCRLSLKMQLLELDKK